MDYCSSSVWMTSTKRCPGLALLLARLSRSPKSTPPQEQESLRSGTRTVTTSWSVHSPNSSGFMSLGMNATIEVRFAGCGYVRQGGHERIAAEQRHEPDAL